MTSTQVRYVLIQRDIKWLYKEKPDFTKYATGHVPQEWWNTNEFSVEYSQDDIFVDILEYNPTSRSYWNKNWAKLRLFYSNGTVVTGWTAHMYSLCPVKIMNMEMLFDGRFNSDQI